MSDDPQSNTVTAPAAPTPRGGGVWRWVLVGSLALNLLFVGVLAGGAVRMHRAVQADGSALADARVLWRAMPDESRAALRAARAGQGRPEHQQGEAGVYRRALLEQLRAESFDPVAFADLLDRQRAGRDAERRATNLAFAQEIARLSMPERLEMAQNVAEAWGRGRRE